MVARIDLPALCGYVRVNRKAGHRLQTGHLWVYESDVVESTASSAGLVELRTENNRVLGTALYSPQSKIRIRLLAGPDEPVTRELLAHRLSTAWHRREQLLAQADAWRWVHGEADLMPGIFVDRYHDCISLQTTCAGADALEPLLVDLVAEDHQMRAVVLRHDASGRAKEGLSTEVQVARGTAPVIAVYHEGELALEVDLLSDQKTGSFLDQAQNHLLARRFAFGQALDCFTYHGGFALQMAQACAHVLACDASAPALVQARKNAARAGLRNIEWIEDDVFKLLAALAAQGRHFDTIVLDPPAFASTSGTVPRALHAYQEINTRAFKLLEPGGILITCSCSGRVGPEDFDHVLAQASTQARRRVQVLQRSGANVDHPVLIGMPETDYLKCRVLRVI